MTIRHLTATAAAMLLATTLTGAAQTDLAGTWILDAARSEGLPPDLEATMTVRQTGDRLEAESLVKSPMGEQKIPEMYVIDGKETDIKVSVAGNPATGKRTSTWRDDKRGFDVTERTVAQIQGEEATITASRKWTLAPDGKTLTVEVTMNGPQGEMRSVRVYTRKA